MDKTDNSRTFVNLVLMLKAKAGNGILILISAVLGIALCNGILI